MSRFVHKVSVTRFLLQAINSHFEQTGFYPKFLAINVYLMDHLKNEKPVYFKVGADGILTLGGIQILPRFGQYPVLVDKDGKYHFI